MGRCFLVFSLALCVATTAASAAPSYTIKDITPTGYFTATAYDINSSGDAVGVATRSVGGSLEESYFFYDHSAGTSTAFGVGTVSPRRSLIGTGFREAAINDSGQIAGTARFLLSSVLESRAFIYSGGTSGTFTDLGVFPPGSANRPGSDALDINASGVATGTASSGRNPSDYSDAYTGTTSPILDFDGETTALSGGDRGRAINNAGVVAGSNQENKAMIASGISETAILTGTSLASADTSVAIDLNEVGQVTGSTSDDSSYIYNTTDSTLRVLPNLAPTAGRVFAKAINESGDTVGWGDRGSALEDQGRGFVYDFSENQSYILEDHVVLTGSTVPGLSDWGDLRTAWGINDSGWIVGIGDRRFDGNSRPTGRAYLLIPIPEPGSIALLSLGGMLWAAKSRRYSHR